MDIAALDPADTRVISANVAGPAALLASKAHKIHDRLQSGRPERVVDKDAADVLRLMQTTAPTAVGKTLARLTNDDLAGPSAQAAVAHLESQFGHRRSLGVQMAVRGMRLAIPEDRVELICTTYTAALLDVSRER